MSFSMVSRGDYHRLIVRIMAIILVIIMVIIMAMNISLRSAPGLSPKKKKLVGYRGLPSSSGTIHKNEVRSQKAVAEAQTILIPVCLACQLFFDWHT